VAACSRRKPSGVQSGSVQCPCQRQSFEATLPPEVNWRAMNTAMSQSNHLAIFW